ncbi:MAG: hypothetical protein WBO45_15450 [Planctomycetota bacterium]
MHRHLSHAQCEVRLHLDLLVQGRRPAVDIALAEVRLLPGDGIGDRSGGRWRVVPIDAQEIEPGERGLAANAATKVEHFCSVWTPLQLLTEPLEHERSVQKDGKPRLHGEKNEPRALAASLAGTHLDADEWAGSS